MARSKPSSTMSMLRSPVLRSTDASGWRRRNSTITGETKGAMWVPANSRKRAAHRRLQQAGGPVGLLQIIEDARAALVIGAADLGQADPPGRAVQQPHTQPLLERLHVIADHGRRHVEPPGCGGKAFGFGDPGENRKTREAVHYPLLEDNLSNQVHIIISGQGQRIFSAPNEENPMSTLLSYAAIAAATRQNKPHLPSKAALKRTALGAGFARGFGFRAASAATTTGRSAGSRSRPTTPTSRPTTRPSRPRSPATSPRSWSRTTSR